MNNSKKLLFASLLAAVSVSVQAQDYWVNNPTGQSGRYSFMAQSPTTGSIAYDLSSPAAAQARPLVAPAPALASEGAATLTIVFDYDATQFSAPWMMRIVGADGPTVVYPPYGENSFDTQVAPGTYDVVCSFTCNQRSYFVIKEQVEVNGATTVTLSPEESVNLVSFKHLNPDGEVMVHALIEYDEQWNATELMPGDLGFTTMLDFVYLKGVGAVGSSMMFFNGGQETEEGRIPNLDFYINDVSDRFTLTQLQISCALDGEWYVSYASTNDAKAGEVCNNYKGYSTANETYAYSAYGDRYPGSGFALPVINIYDNRLADINAPGSFDPAANEESTVTYTIHSDLPYQDPYDANLKFLIASQFNDYCATIVESWGSYEKYYKTACKPYTFVNGVQRYVAVPHIDMDNQLTPLANVATANGSVGKQMLPANDAFTFDAADCKLTFGATTPINAVIVQNHGPLYGEYGSGGLRPWLVGRLGEVRGCDDENTIVSASFNGEAIADITQWTEVKEGVYDVTYESSNILIGDMVGENITTLHFDQNQDDATPPSLQMLMLKDANGIVTDTFELPTDGTLFFSAADFNQNYADGSNQWSMPFDVALPASVSVEYSTFEENEWLTLVDNLAPTDPSTFATAWGYLYSTSLSGVAQSSDSGWYDLKLKLTDASGNWQEQVISPAFCINKLSVSGIDSVAAEAEADTTVYDIYGRKVDGSQLSRGIYIVGHRKIMVR